jgi:plastocyanin domain-containing protein
MKSGLSSLASLAVLLLTIQSLQAWSPQQVQEATIKVTEKGYEPNELRLLLGVPARVTFVRETEATCGTEVVLPEYDIERKLPLNEPVVIEFTPEKSGEFGFACGMNMVKGKLVVSEN